MLLMKTTQLMDRTQLLKLFIRYCLSEMTGSILVLAADYSQC